MRPPRGPLGPGAFVLIAAMVVVPEILRQCKPFAKTVGEAVVKLGEGIQRIAESEGVCGSAAEPAQEAGAPEVVAESPVAGEEEAMPAEPNAENQKKAASGRKKPTEEAS